MATDFSCPIESSEVLLMERYASFVVLVAQILGLDFSFVIIKGVSRGR